MNLQAMAGGSKHWLIALTVRQKSPVPSDAQIAQIAVSIAGLGSKPESGLYQGWHHRRAAGACSPRESSCSKTFPSLVEISVLIAGFVLFVIATAIVTTYLLPKRARGNAYSP